MRLEFLINFKAKQFVEFLAIAYLTFSLLFFTLGQVSPENSITNKNEEIISLEESFYFSLCTMSKGCIGYYEANGISKWAYTFEVILGLFLFGMFISKLVGGRTSKMLEKVYEEQIKRKLYEYCENWGNQRKKLALLVHKTLGGDTDAERELLIRVTKPVSDNLLKRIGDSMHSCTIFMKKNYNHSFVDKKFDDHVLTKLLRKTNETLKSLNLTIPLLEKTKLKWKNNYVRENMIKIKDSSIELKEIALEKLTDPIPIEAIKLENEIEKQLELFDKKIK